MPLLLLWCLPYSLFLLVDPVDNFCVIVGNVENFRGLVARHAQVFDHEDKLEAILVGNGIVLAFVKRVCVFVRAGAVEGNSARRTTLCFRL